MRYNPEQLSFWGPGKIKINPKSVNVVEDNSQKIQEVKVSFEYSIDKDMIIEFTFIFEGSIEKYRYERKVLKASENLNKNTWIKDSHFKEMKRRAIAIAKEKFSSKVKQENLPDEKQLKIFE